MSILEKFFGKKKQEVEEVATAEQPKAEPNDMRNHVTWKILDIDVSEAGNYPTTLDDIFQGKIDGLYIRNVVGTEMMENIEEYLCGITKEKDNIVPEDTPFGFVIGRAITACRVEELEPSYFPETQVARNIAEHIFNRPVDDIIEKALTPLAGGRSVAMAKHKNGELYKPCTFRVFKPGHAEGIRVHIGNEFLQNIPQLEYISSQVDNVVQLSYFIVVQKPEKGGELQIFDKVWKDTPKEMVAQGSIVRLMEEREKSFENVQSVKVVPNKGDMFLFDGGRIWHKITPIEGNVTRITAGGFVTFSKDGKHMYYYA